MKNELKIAHATDRPRIVGLSHIGLFAHDLTKSIEFYQDFLGFEEQFELTEADGTVALKFMKINDRQFIELFPERDSADERLYQVAFIVENVEALRLFMKSRGIEVPERVNKGRIGNLSFSTRDPDGHILEFVQYSPDGWTLKDSGKHLGERRISARLKHIGFTVRSLNSSLAFYRDVLGCTETWRGSGDGKSLSWVNMKLPDSDEYLELMLYDESLSRERLGILNHMSLEVDDVGTAVEILTERAASGLYEKPIQPRTGINRKRQLNLFDPDLTRAELMDAVTVDGMSPQWFEPAAARE
jgi:lactoylglutathione lyase